MKNTLLFFAFYFWVTCAFAQTAPIDSLKQVTITTKDGNELVGTIVLETDTTVVLKLPSVGNVVIPRQTIDQIKPLIKAKTETGEVFWNESPHTTRYYFQPNAYGLRKGEGYYQNAWVFYNQVSYGFSDYFSMGVGTVPLFLFNGTPSPVWVTPKVSVPLIKNKLNAGAGILAGTVAGADWEGNNNFGIGYGILSVGSRERNLTMGVGYGFAGGEVAKNPIFSLGGMCRVGKRWAFVSENYFIRNNGESLGLVSFGGRFIARYVSIDGALVAPAWSGQDSFFAIPWLGINVPFGRRK